MSPSVPVLLLAACLLLGAGCGSQSLTPDVGGAGVDASAGAAPDTGGPSPDSGPGPDGPDGGLGDWPGTRTLTCEQVRATMLARDPRALYLNVADEEFYSLGHLEGSSRIPWDELSARLAEVDPGRYVVLYCRRGVRSESAQATLAGAGYPHTWIMEGGIERWNALGYPTVP